MFTITALPAAQGDALWVEYGNENSPSRIIIDGGTLSTEGVVRQRIAALALNDRVFDLLVVTHVDSDHIAGVVKLLNDKNLGARFRDVWFNAWRHLDEDTGDVLGPVEGEFLSSLITDRHYAWNKAFKGKAVVTTGSGPLPSVTLDGGMKLTLLSPTRATLDRLKPEWAKTVKAAGLDPGDVDAAREELASRRKYAAPDVLGGAIPIASLAKSAFKSDTAKPNATSIAFIAEFDGKSCLFTGDAHMGVLVPAVQRVCADRSIDRLKIDVLKLPHHGSRANLSVEFLRTLDCASFIVSSSGAIFGHPDREAMSRVIVHGGNHPTIYFNYRSKFNKVWDSAPLRAKFGYTTKFPDGEDGIVLEL
jgi:beta-lactamase superfamily II metal-dependent hydrolase